MEKGFFSPLICDTHQVLHGWGGTRLLPARHRNLGSSWLCLGTTCSLGEGPWLCSSTSNATEKWPLCPQGSVTPAGTAQVLPQRCPSTSQRCERPPGACGDREKPGRMDREHPWIRSRLVFVRPSKLSQGWGFFRYHLVHLGREAQGIWGDVSGKFSKHP